MPASALLRILLIALSLGLDVFAVCIGVGMRGVERAVGVRIAAAFAGAEVSMNIVGAGVGRLVEGLIGQAAAYVGFAALVCVGAYMIVENIRESESALDLSHGWGLLTAALAISLDSLGIGFSIVYVGIPLPLSLAIIAGVSVLCSSLGLLFGRMLGRHVEELIGVFAGALLIATGLLFAFMRYYHIE